jgi:hypothetical protein
MRGGRSFYCADGAKCAVTVAPVRFYESLPVLVRQNVRVEWW